MTGTLSGVGDSIGSAVGKAGDSVGTAARKARTPAIVGTAAAAGLAGGLALGARMLSQQRVGGIPMKRSGKALKSVAREVQQVGKDVSKAGFRLGVGDVNVEVRRDRKQRGDSPVEVLLQGLTSRRAQRR